MAQGKHRRSLDGWIDRLAGSGLPIFSETVRQVSGVASARESSARDLAEAIGRDASLAARLLKIANSPLFNLANRNVDTISEAVVMIGFDAIRELAVSLALIEQVLKGRQHARVTQSMSRAFHAAAQARSFAAGRRDRCPEEVFVAALLLRLGEMAFWASAEEEAAAIERMTRSGASLSEAEHRVLGFRLEELTRRLVEEWHLGGLLERAAAGEDDERIASVRLGHDVAAAVEQFGWNSREVRGVLDKVAEHVGLNSARVKELVGANVEEAGRIASRYGVPAVEAYLLEHEHPEPDRVVTGGGPRAPDAALQLAALKRIGDHLEGRVDLSELLRLVLEGIHEGAGLDRTFFALLSRDQKSLEVRHALGGSETDRIALDDSPGRDLFRAALSSGKLIHVTEENLATMKPLITPAIAPRIGVPFLAMPIRVAGKAVGLLYADNAVHGRAIDDESLSAFRHFGQQISLGLAANAG